MPGIWCWNGENSRDRQNSLLAACSSCLWLCRECQPGLAQGGCTGEQCPPLAPCARTGTLLQLCPWAGGGSLGPCPALRWHSWVPRAPGTALLVLLGSLGVPGSPESLTHSRCSSCLKANQFPINLIQILNKSFLNKLLHISSVPAHAGAVPTQ